jgi:hypothetical protein
VLIAVAAVADFAFALVALARGAEALGGVEQRRGEKGQRCDGGEDGPPERGAYWPKD